MQTAPKRIPAEPQQDEPKDHNKNQTTHPNPYVPLPGFWLSGSGLRCRWLLQSVANCFRRGLTAETVADCSQTVAIGCKTRKSADSVSRWVRAIPFLDEGANRLPMESNPPPRRRKTSSDLVHLRSLLSVQPATNTGQVTAAWGEIEAGLARGMKLREVWEAAKLRWAGDSVPAIPRLCFAATARRQRPSTSAPQPPPALSKRRARAASSAATRSVQQSAGAAGEKETIGIRIRSVLD